MAESGNLSSLLCFLCDDASIETIENISVNTLGITSQVKKGGIQECMQYLKKNKSPDILIVDISESNLPITDMAKLAEACEPGVEVIVVGNRNEVGLFRDLIRLGTRDYLVKPITSAHILHTLENIVHEEKKQTQQGGFTKSGKLVTFIGALGGCGVSTLTANSAWALAEKNNKSVSLIDLDIQLGILPHFFDLETSMGLQELFDTPERIDETLISRSMAHVGQNLTILSSQVTLQEQPTLRLDALESITQELISQVHFILIDLPRTFNTAMNIFLLQRSNTVVIVTDYSLIGLKETSRILELLKDRLIQTQEILIVVNKVGQYKAGALSREMFEESLQRKVSLEIPFDALRPLEALRDGIPLVSKMNSPVSAGILSIVDRLLGRETQQKALKGLMKFFKKS